MSKIITTKEKYFTRSGEPCLIAVEILSFTNTTSSYDLLISDTAVNWKQVEMPPVNAEDDPTFETVLTVVERIGNRQVHYSREEIDVLFAVVKESIDPKKGYTEQMNKLLGDALLIVTKAEPLYGTTAEEWELVPKKAPK